MRTIPIAVFAGALILLGHGQLYAKKPGEPVAEKVAPEAKESAAASTAKSEQAPKVKVERRAGGRKVFRITTGFVIEGRIQKPNAFYVLQRSQINYDWAKLKKDFTKRILEPLEASPF